MPSTASRLLLLLVLGLTGCAGASEHEACVEHSVEEGVERELAERVCEQTHDE